MTERLKTIWEDHVRALGKGGEIDDAARSTIEARLKEGGRLRVAGPRHVVEAWVRHQAESAGRSVAVLDLDGWEPDLEHLGPLASYLQTLRNLSEVPQAARGAAGAGALDAARLSLAMMDGAGDAFQNFDLRQALVEASASGSWLLFVPDADLLPVNLRQVLEDVCGTDSGMLWVEQFPSHAITGPSDEAGLPPALAEEAHLELKNPTAETSPEWASAIEEVGKDLAASCPEALRGPCLQALGWWATLERPLPLEPFFAHLGLDPEAREDAVDWLDDEISAEEDAEQDAEEGVGALAIVRDLQFLHPSFEDAVYCLSHGAWKEAACLVELGDAETVATGLRLRLKARRGSFLLLLRLAELAGDWKEASAMRRRLRWWFEPTDLAGVTDRELSRGRVSADEIWAAAADPFAPSGHRLVFLDAWALTEDGQNPAKQGTAYMLRSEVLHRMKETSKALDAARRGLEIQGLNHGPRSSPYLGALHQTAVILIEEGQEKEAVELMDASVELAAELLPESDPKRIMIQENHGRALARAGRLRDARKSLETAHGWTVSARGEDHPSVALSGNNLAGLLLEMGELEEAEVYLRRSAELFESHFGPRSMENYGALRNLAKVFHELNRFDELMRLLERLAPLEESLLGPSHPNLVGTWARLAELKRDRGEVGEARFLLGRALETALEVFLEDHPSIAVLRQTLESLDAESSGEEEQAPS